MKYGRKLNRLGSTMFIVADRDSFFTCLSFLAVLLEELSPSPAAEDAVCLHIERHD